MNARHKSISRFLGIALLTLPLVVLGQDEDSSSPGEVDDPFALDGVEAASDEQPKIDNEFTIGLYYLDDDSYRYGKYTGLTDEGFYLLGDFRIEKRPEWDGDDTRRWRVQGWRLGLESRRIQFDYTQQGTQSFSAEYREIPNYRFDDGLIPYRDSGSDTVGLASGWEVAEGSSNTRGFLTLDESLTSLKMDTKRRRLKMTYDRNLGKQWNLKVDYSHETKKGGRTIGSIFGYTGGNPRAVLLAAPVDYKTDNIEAMFGYANFRTQFGFGFYGSFFNNDKTSLTWQNAYGHQSQWADGVNFPGSQGRLALEPDNSFVQFKAHAGFNFASSTRLTANVAFGEMKQNDHLLQIGRASCRERV
jgi:MtrB/PioB family decaheme-associated outer membrane protein